MLIAIPAQSEYLDGLAAFEPVKGSDKTTESSEAISLATLDDDRDDTFSQCHIQGHNLCRFFRAPVSQKMMRRRNRRLPKAVHSVP
jgi:hypothetical protein